MQLNRLKFNANKIKIILMGDEHLGSKYYDKELHKRWINWILKEPNTYVIGMGDHLETATKNSIGAGVFEQDKVVQEQLEASYELYKPLADKGKLLGMHIGNHEERLYKHSGMDLIKTLCKMLSTKKYKVKYYGIGVLHYIKVDSQSYTMYTTHGHSGARLPYTKIKACIDLGNMVDVDIYAMGHTHQLSHHVRQFYKVNKRDSTVTESGKHYLLTGSFLTHWGSYAQEAGYEMMRRGCPTVKLHGRENKIRVSIG